MDIDIRKEPLTLVEIESLKRLYRRNWLLYLLGCVLIVGLYFWIAHLIDTTYHKDISFKLEDAILLNLITLVAHFLGVCFCIGKGIHYMALEHDLTEAKPESCLDIKKYLALPEIKAYRDKVIGQPCKFNQSEVDVMREHYENHQRYLAGEDVRQACREVYGVTEGEE